MFNRLMGGPVLAHAYGIVSKNIYHGQLHKSAHAHGVLHIVGEYEESGAIGGEPAVQIETVADCGHCMLADAKMEVGAQPVFRRIIIPALHVALVAGSKVGAAAEEIGLKLGYAVEHLA